MTEIAPVEVSRHVAALPGDLFSYLTDPARYVQWMGSQAVLEPVPGGDYRVRMPDGSRPRDRSSLSRRRHRVVFTWGFADDEAAARTKHAPGEAAGACDSAVTAPVTAPAPSAMPGGGTRVTATLEAEDGGTRLTLRHENLPSAELRHGHDVAWNVYLPRLAIRAAGGDPGPGPIPEPERFRGSVRIARLR